MLCDAIGSIGNVIRDRIICLAAVSTIWCLLYARGTEYATLDDRRRHCRASAADTSSFLRQRRNVTQQPLTYNSRHGLLLARERAVSMADGWKVARVYSAVTNESTLLQQQTLGTAKSDSRKATTVCHVIQKGWVYIVFVRDFLFSVLHFPRLWMTFNTCLTSQRLCLNFRNTFIRH